MHVHRKAKQKLHAPAACILTKLYIFDWAAVCLTAHRMLEM